MVMHVNNVNILGPIVVWASCTVQAKYFFTTPDPITKPG